MCDSKRASQPDVKTSGFFLPEAFLDRLESKGNGRAHY